MCKLHFPAIIKTIGFAFLSFFLFQWLKQAISQLWFATTSTYDTRIQHRYSKDTAGTQILHKTCEASDTTWHDMLPILKYLWASSQVHAPMSIQWILVVTITFTMDVCLNNILSCLIHCFKSVAIFSWYLIMAC